jgi:thymidylate kinase
MTIRDCRVAAIDGTHASGKTTLIHALTAHYRRQGVNVVAMGEPARASPFMEEIVIHGRGIFDLAAEVDVFAAHLRYQLRTARNHQLLIADKTIINVLAYAQCH